MSARPSVSLAKPAWWQRVSPRMLPVFAVGAAFCIFVVLTLADYLGMRYPGWVPSMWIVDLAVASVCGILFANTIHGAQTRHRHILQRLNMIAEMNHHIRNALDQIHLSAHTSHDQQFMNNLHQATARIEWALREVLPQGDEDEENRLGEPPPR
jgi:hypothetical protein